MINQADVKGEADTGFEERSDKGPFQCGNCSFFRDDSCGQKVMIAKSKQPLTKDGRREVGKQDCCEYVDRIGQEKRIL